MKDFPAQSISSPLPGGPARGTAQHSAAAERNRAPILQALRQLLPARGSALEIASGTGQHAAWFAAGLPQWEWQPTDVQADSFGSIRSWCAQAGVSNVSDPLLLNVLLSQWPSADCEFPKPFDAIYCANMLHISPWSTCAALMQGAARYLTPQGTLVTYGPYLQRDVPTSSGNLDFDASLRRRNPDWGIRTLEAVTREATLAGLHLTGLVQMPSNNLLLAFRKEST